MTEKIFALIISTKAEISNKKILGLNCSEYVENALEEIKDSLYMDLYINHISDDDYTQISLDSMFEFKYALFINGDMPLIKPKTIKKLIKTHLNSLNAVTFLSDNNGARYDNIFILNTEAIKGVDLRVIKSFAKNHLRRGDLFTKKSNQFIQLTDSLSYSKITELKRKEINKTYMKNGVLIISPKTVYIDFGVEINKGTVIYPNNTITGKTKIGENCIIGSNNKINNSVLHYKASIEYSVVTDCEIGSNTKVGPFAYVRPNSVIGEDVKIGDFVEVKNSNIGDNTKISHLSYVGDSDVGKNVNIGCGTITSNYDGKNKFRTVIEDNAFIGCNSNLVAPVTVEENSFVAAGSTITKRVPKDSLAIARTKQVIKDNWKSPINR